VPRERDGGRERLAYGLREVAGLLGLGEGQIRGWVRAGFLEPGRGPRGELRFSFQDLAFLRLVRDLASARVPPRRVRRALGRLKAELGAGAPLSSLRVAAAGDEVVARREGVVWNAVSGQRLFDFDALPAPEVVDLARVAGAEEVSLELAHEMDAADWYELGCELHEGEPDAARAAYERALALDPELTDAHVNLGCVLHDAGKLADAEVHYRAALARRPDDAVAWFDLGVALEDQRRLAEARAAYEASLGCDPACADAHYNLARIHDRAGGTAAALRHLREYLRLMRAR
jgi:tetratricopeptide (TPR) repeat protein